MPLSYRLFAPRDEPQVRAICFETALHGEPMRSVFDDERLVSEALVGYYIRHEPESLFVAEEDGIVVGYLTACADTRSFERSFAFGEAPRLLLRFLLRGHFLRRRTWQLLCAMLRYGRALQGFKRTVSDDYPDHLHLNLRASSRGKGIGSELLRRYLECARRRGIRGICVSTQGEEGMRFFARAGFEVLASFQLPSLATGSAMPSWLMGKALTGGSP